MVVRLAVSLVLVAACHPSVAPPPGGGGEADGSDVVESSDDDPEDPNDQLPDVAPDVAPAQTGGGAALLAEAQRELAAVQRTHYEHHTHVDESAGVFDYDCSGFVGYALSRSAPEALRAVQDATKKRPLAKHFEAVFAAPRAPWTRLTRADELMPGDVIAWLEPAAKHSRNTGHIMIVAEAPRGGSRVGEEIVPVIDSSHSGHGRADARVRDHTNGLGQGEIVLIVDDAGQPIGYRWSTWARSKPYHTAIALGRIAG